MSELRLCERCSHLWEEHASGVSYFGLDTLRRDTGCYCCGCPAFVDEPDFTEPVSASRLTERKDP